MNEYISLENTDYLIKDKTYLGYEKRFSNGTKSIALTHVVSGERVVQLTNVINTHFDSVKLVGTNRNPNMLNTNAKPYPRKRDHLFNINR